MLKALKIAEPAVRRDASLIYPTDRPLTPAAALLLDEVRRVAKERQAKNPLRVTGA